MSPLIWIGICVGIALAIAYLIAAIKLKAAPQLEHMVHLFFSAVGLMGAVRIVGFIACGAFGKLLKDEVNTGPFAISDEDAVTLVVAAVALAWISIKLIWKPFQELKAAADKTKKAAPPAPPPPGPAPPAPLIADNNEKHKEK
jgi:autotransporter translocation and assembly factor TamB